MTSFQVTSSFCEVAETSFPTWKTCPGGDSWPVVTPHCSAIRSCCMTPLYVLTDCRLTNVPIVPPSRSPWATATATAVFPNPGDPVTRPQQMISLASSCVIWLTNTSLPTSSTGCGRKELRLTSVMSTFSCDCLATVRLLFLSRPVHRVGNWLVVSVWFKER